MLCFPSYFVLHSGEQAELTSQIWAQHGHKKKGISTVHGGGDSESAVPSVSRRETPLILSNITKSTKVPSGKLFTLINLFTTNCVLNKLQILCGEVHALTLLVVGERTGREKSTNL